MDKTGRGQIFRANIVGNILKDLTASGKNLMEKSTVAESKGLGFKVINITQQYDSEVLTVLTPKGRAATVVITVNQSIDLLKLLSTYVLPKIAYYEEKLSRTNTTVERYVFLHDWALTIDSHITDACPGLKFSLAVAVPYFQRDKLAYAGFGGGNTGIWIKKPNGEARELTPRNAEWMQCFDEESVIGSEMVACTYTRFNTDKFASEHAGDSSQDWVVDCKAEAPQTTIASTIQNALAQNFDNCVGNRLNKVVSHYNYLQELEAIHFVLGGIRSAYNEVMLGKAESKTQEKSVLFLKVIKENYDFMLKAVVGMTQLQKNVKPMFEDALQNLHNEVTLKAAVEFDMQAILQNIFATLKSDPSAVLKNLDFTIQTMQEEISAQRQITRDMSDYNYRVYFGTVYEPKLAQRMDNQQAMPNKPSVSSAKSSRFLETSSNKTTMDKDQSSALQTPQESGSSGRSLMLNFGDEDEG